MNAASAKEAEKGESVKQNAGASKNQSTPKSKDNSKTGSAQTASSKGRTLFESHCASCHAGGGNLVVPKKPVIGSHVLVTGATFKSYLNEPVGTMPHYQHLIQDDSLLNELYSYVKSMKAAPAAPVGKGAVEKKLDKPAVKKQK
jgi:mono/diheme cytochrome c family protein